MTAIAAGTVHRVISNRSARTLLCDECADVGDRPCVQDMPRLDPSPAGGVVGSEERGNTVIIEAEVPLSEMFGYTTELRSMSTGRAAAAMEPLKYAPVPTNVRNAILEEVA